MRQIQAWRKSGESETGMTKTFVMDHFPDAEPSVIISRRPEEVKNQDEVGMINEEMEKG